MRIRTFPRFPALALLLSLVAVAPFALPREAYGDGAFVDLTDVTYVGTTADGATITITVDEAHTGVLRAEVANLTIPALPGGCPASEDWATSSYSPPAPISSGAFEVHIARFQSAVVIQGAFDQDGNLSGTAGFYLSISGCYTPTVPWTAGAPVETPPDDNDMRYDGTPNSGGSFAFWVDRDTNAVTAFEVTSLDVPPCIDSFGPDAGRTFYQPSLPIAPNGAVQMTVVFWPFRYDFLDATISGGSAAGDLYHRVDLYTVDCVTPWTATRETTDTDLDGCIDPMEASVNRSLGGGRNPKVFWDFYDVPTMPGLVRNKSVSVSDIAAVVARFGSNSLPPSDKASALAEALTTPPAPPAYHTAYDRSSVPGFGSGPPDGAVGVSDISLAVMQFGASCA